MSELTTNVRVIAASDKQIDDLVPLFDSYRQFYKQDSDPGQARRFLEDRLRNEESVLFLAYEHDTAVGFTQLYPSFSSVSLKKLWILNDLYVIPEMRGRRIGEMLIGKAAELSRSTGGKGLILSTSVHNHSAQTLYERVGFEKDLEFYHYFMPTV
ncbi:GNAT family N-acetyltransferase [Paenibacillus lutrae]|uniref:GNAT family N-acetyltransferase n=1 Tax=Paenibacillus lutrae TaxID=2078573 RepID=A0A7X3K1C1_9BACL|nr:GNAT family N-acetyltransferase [Paenibacillus lutrae]MVP01960.1 GNAT family N-acetyltransferase [Paenibacillus lutrae]